MVPGLEDVSGLGVRQTGSAQQGVGLTDELHVGVLDAVVDHLDEVSGAIGAHPCAAGLAVDLCRDLLQNRTDGFVRLWGAAWHD